MTFNDFIVECTLYSNSNEHYELCKECAEVELGEKYMENQRILTESLEDIVGEGIIDNDNVTLTESYLMESADEESLQTLYEEVEEKKKGIASKLIAGVKRWIDTFAKFLLRITGTLGKEQSELEALKADLAAANDKNGEKVQSMYAAKIAQLQKVGIELISTHERKKITGENEKLKAENKDLQEDKDKATKKIADLQKQKKDTEKENSDLKHTAGMKNDEISGLMAKLGDKEKAYLALKAKHEGLVKLTGGNLSYAITADQLSDIITAYGKEVNNGGTSPAKIKSIHNQLKSYIGEAHSGGGIKYTCSTTVLNRCNSKLTKINEALNNASSETASAEKISAANALSADISKALADTMKVYTHMTNCIKVGGSKKSTTKKDAKSA